MSLADATIAAQVPFPDPLIQVHLTTRRHLSYLTIVSRRVVLYILPQSCATISAAKMSHNNVIILYDVPSTVPQPWVPNIWRIRYGNFYDLSCGPLSNSTSPPYAASYLTSRDSLTAPSGSNCPTSKPPFVLSMLLRPLTKAMVAPSTHSLSSWTPCGLARALPCSPTLTPSPNT